MKKYFLLLLILPVLALSACSLTKEETTVSEEVTTERHEFTAYDHTFSYEGNGEVTVGTADYFLSREFTKDELAYFEELNVDQDRVTYNDELYISKNLYSKNGSIANFDPSKINYECDGTFVKISPSNDELRWQYCETNEEDYLKQFEYGTIHGAISTYTGGGYGTWWSVIYSKNMNGVNYFFTGALEGESWHFLNADVNEFCTEDNVCYDFDSKEYLDYLLEQEDNQKRLAEWDKFVGSIELVK